MPLVHFLSVFLIPFYPTRFLSSSPKLLLHSAPFNRFQICLVYFDLSTLLPTSSQSSSGASLVRAAWITCAAATAVWLWKYKLMQRSNTSSFPRALSVLLGHGMTSYSMSPCPSPRPLSIECFSCVVGTRTSICVQSSCLPFPWHVYTRHFPQYVFFVSPH